MSPEDLKTARKNLGLSIEDFATVFGVTEGRTVRGWEFGRRGTASTSIPEPIALLVQVALKFPSVRAWLCARVGLK